MGNINFNNNGNPSLEVGGVAFGSSNQVITTGASFLFWDQVNHRLGINQAGVAPSALVDVRQTGITVPNVQANNIGSQGATGGGLIQAQADPGAATTSGSRLGVLQFGGAQDNASTIYSGAQVQSLATENWSGTAGGAKLAFSVTANTTHTKSTALTLNQDGGASFIGSVSGTTFVGALSGSASGLAALTTNGQLPYYAAGVTGLAIGTTGQILTVGATFPVWVTPATSGSAAAWSGFHNSSWTWTGPNNAAYANFSNGATGTFSTRYNKSFGTVTTEGLSAMPAIVFTPGASGNWYHITVVPNAGYNSLNNEFSLRLWDGASTIATNKSRTPAANLNLEPCTLSGLYQAPSGATVTLTIQGATNGAGSASMGDATQLADAINWTIVQII